MENTQAPVFTYSRLRGQAHSTAAHGGSGGGSGWDQEGNKLFNNLLDDVKDDRAQHARNAKAGDAITFNNELYQCYQQRRNREREQTQRVVTQKSTAERELPIRCFDEFEEFSDTDEEEDKRHAPQRPSPDIDEVNNNGANGEQQCFV